MDDKVLPLAPYCLNKQTDIQFTLFCTAYYHKLKICLRGLYNLLMQMYLLKAAFYLFFSGDLLNLLKNEPHRDPDRRHLFVTFYALEQVNLFKKRDRIL